MMLSDSLLLGDLKSGFGLILGAFTILTDILVSNTNLDMNASMQ